MNRQSRVAISAALLALIGGCAPAVPSPEASPEARSPGAPAAPETSAKGRVPGQASANAPVDPAPEAPELGFTVVTTLGHAAPAYESMDPSAEIAFEAEPGSGGLVLGSAAYEKDGQRLTYWHVDTESGRGWIWEKHVTVHPRAKAVARAQDDRPPLEISMDVRPAEGASPAAALVARDASPRGSARAGSGESDDESWGTSAGASSAGSSGAPDVLTINSGGAEVTISQHLVRGQYTIVDFYSEHCGPCRRLAPQLATIAQKHPKIVLRKVDIDRPGSRGIDWQSPVARQHGIQSVPHVELYGPSGALEAEGDAALDRLQQIARGG